MKVLGVITARGGSKGIPGKNLKLLAGKPLIVYTIDAARESGALDRVILSTDDSAIADQARLSGCEVPFLRPPDIARDDTPHLPVIQHAVEWLDRHEHYRPDAVMTLQPTSPLRAPIDIVEAIRLLEQTGADSVVGVSAVPAHFNPMRMLRADASGNATLFVSGEGVRRRINRRQDMPDAWTMNGAIYLFRTDVLTATEPSLYGDRTVVYRMPEVRGISIDDMDDWTTAENALLQGSRNHRI